MSEEVTLFPCPACNDEASILENVIDNPWGGDITVYSVQCTRCGLLTGQYGYKRQALEYWNAIPRALRWTKETPKKPGWYWCRDYGKYIHIIQVCVDLSEYQELHDVEWAGPISEPREAEHD